LKISRKRRKWKKSQNIADTNDLKLPIMDEKEYWLIDQDNNYFKSFPEDGCDNLFWFFYLKRYGEKMYTECQGPSVHFNIENELKTKLVLDLPEFYLNNKHIFKHDEL